jgi:hypothetical protein
VTERWELRREPEGTVLVMLNVVPGTTWTYEPVMSINGAVRWYRDGKPTTPIFDGWPPSGRSEDAAGEGGEAVEPSESAD